MRVRETIERTCRSVGRDPGSVALCAVTKKVEWADLEEAVRGGIRILGENRVQEAEGKIARAQALEGLVEWRLVGHLQSNKARRAVQLFDSIDSIDSVALARRLGALGVEADSPVRILVEVKTSREAEKTGIALEGAEEAVGRIREIQGLRVEGLMTMAPLTDDQREIRASFAALRHLRERLTKAGELRELSMGMSADYPLAIEEGATMVRIGTALFA
jgi:pyridoxal phosphate enzyme (YggS family)